MLSSSSIGCTEALCGGVAVIVAVQLLTPANPIGSSLRLLRQFRSQVREIKREGGREGEIFKMEHAWIMIIYFRSWMHVHF